MNHGIKKEMLSYFKSMNNRTPQENRFLMHLQSEVENFDITSVSLDDVAELGYEITEISNSIMEELSYRMADSYCDNGYWDDLRLHLENMGIPKRNYNNE